MWQCNIAVNGQVTQFSTEVSSFIYEFLDQMFIEAQTACLSLTDDADIRKRKSYFLKRFRDLLDDGILEKMYSVSKYEGRRAYRREETDNIWIRHLRSFERNHDVAFDLGIDNMIDEWTRMKRTKAA
jgi:hypothetical protein